MNYAELRALWDRLDQAAAAKYWSGMEQYYRTPTPPPACQVQAPIPPSPPPVVFIRTERAKRSSKRSVEAARRHRPVNWTRYWQSSFSQGADDGRYRLHVAAAGITHGTWLTPAAHPDRFDEWDRWLSTT